MKLVNLTESVSQCQIFLFLIHTQQIVFMAGAEHEATKPALMSRHDMSGVQVYRQSESSFIYSAEET